jgi:hypothetical protein
VALPRRNASRPHREGDSGRASSSVRPGQPGCARPTGRDAKPENPFDVHPKNFTDHSLIWEVYKSDKE